MVGDVYEVLKDVKQIIPINYRELLNSETYPIGTRMVVVSEKHGVKGMRLLSDEKEITPDFGKPWVSYVLWQEEWFNKDFVRML